MVHGGSRSFLVVLGGSLWFLVVPHVFFLCFWAFLAVLWDYLRILLVIGSSCGSMWFFVFLCGYWWFCLVLCGCWRFLVVPGFSFFGSQ